MTRCDLVFCAGLALALLSSTADASYPYATGLLAVRDVGPATAHTPACSAVPDAPASICRTTAHGWAYADSEEGAERAATALEATAAAFEKYFGRVAPNGALVLSATFDRAAADRFSNTHGLGYVLTWLPPEDTRTKVEQVMRRAMPNADEAKIERALEQLDRQHEDTLRHELGHSLYGAAFWPHVEAVTAGHYGSPAPDWLDESAALLMEGAGLRQQRESSFLDALRQQSGRVAPIDDFIARDHPITAQARDRLMAQSGQQTQSGIQIMAAAGEEAARVAAFYSQSLAFADFLIYTSKDLRILGKISTAVTEGANFNDWLANTGPRHGLPGNLPALQSAWDSWCQGKLSVQAAETARGKGDGGN